MRRAAVGTLVEEYVARADQAAAEFGTIPEMTHRLQARLGASAFYTFQERQEELLRSWWEQPPPTDYPGAGAIYRIGDEPIEEQFRLGRERVFRAGAIVRGIGCIPTALGLAFIPFTVGLSAIAATPGIGMLVTGIALLISGRKP